MVAVGNDTVKVKRVNKVITADAQYGRAVGDGLCKRGCTGHTWVAVTWSRGLFTCCVTLLPYWVCPMQSPLLAMYSN